MSIFYCSVQIALTVKYQGPQALYGIALDLHSTECAGGGRGVGLRTRHGIGPLPRAAKGVSLDEEAGKAQQAIRTHRLPQKSAQGV